MSDTNGDPLSNRVKTLPEAAIFRMAQRARELQAEGHHVVNLTVGQPDFDTPDVIKDAAKQALDDGVTKYTPIPGLPELRSAIAQKFAEDNKIDYSTDEIVVSNGAKQSIFNVCMALLNPGDDVLLTAPYWASYLGIIALSGAKTVICPTNVDEGFKASAAKLESFITDKTRLMILNTPGNPTGAVYTAGELDAIADMMVRHPNLYILSDEIYETINFTAGHASLAAFEKARARTITVNGFSKAFAMTGWRLGYMGANAQLARACVQIQTNVTSGAGSFAQAAAIEALNGGRAQVDQMVAAYRSRRDLVVSLLEAMPDLKISVPDGAFYVFPDISRVFGKSADGAKITSTTAFCDYLLNKFHLSLVPGTAFGDDNCVRLSFAASEDQLKAGLERLGNALTTLE